MSYNGSTFSIPFNKGGFTGNPNVDIIAPEMMITPTRNINLHENGRGSRGGTSHANASAITSTPQIMGLFDYQLENGNQFVMIGTDTGIIYQTNNFSSFTSLKSGLTANQYFDFVTFNNEVYCSNGSNPPEVWDGSAGATSTIGNVATDWSGGGPKQLVKHGRGNSERLWAISVSAKPHYVYASKLNDGSSEADFSDSEVVAFHIETGDGDGIVGGAEFGDRLICFGKNKSYLVDDLDINSSNWGYTESQWEGGASHHRLIIRVPNDLICMMDDGTIYSVVAAQNYGDYKQASLTHPSFMSKWIKDNVDLTSIAKFHGIYDSKLRAIKIYVVRQGQTNIDTALIYFLDRGPIEGWAIHSNQSSDSGYTASASMLYKVGVGNYQVYTGDYSGFIWNSETTNKNDNNNSYYAGFKTPSLNFKDTRTSKLFQNLWLIAKASGNYDLQVKIWIDEILLGAQIVLLGSTGVVLGTFVLGTDYLVGSTIIDKMLGIRAKGKRIQFEIYNSNTNEDFFISSMLIDYKPLGRQPE